MSDREAFEQWLLDEQGLVGSWDYERGCYSEFPAHLAYKAWQAAREQEGGEAVEPAGYIQCDGARQLRQGHPARIYPPGAMPSPFESTIRLYDHPQPAQQGSVPEGWRKAIPQAKEYPDSTEDLVSDAQIRGWNMCRIEVIQALSQLATPATGATPQPGDDGWIKCSERLPTESDEDFNGEVWVFDPVEPVSIILCESREVSGPNVTHWKPTGLTRPQPPKTEGGSE